MLSGDTSLAGDLIMWLLIALVALASDRRGR